MTQSIFMKASCACVAFLQKQCKHIIQYSVCHIQHVRVLVIIFQCCFVMLMYFSIYNCSPYNCL